MVSAQLSQRVLRDKSVLERRELNGEESDGLCFVVGMGMSLWFEGKECSA